MHVSEPARQPESYDCVVIGAGHNALVCAAYLARAGKSVLVLEAAGQVGGAATTREFAPGFKVSACAHLLHLMPADILNELGLAKHGLVLASRNMPTTALREGAAPFTIDERGLSLLSPRDAASYKTYSAQMRKFAAVLMTALAGSPPRLGTNELKDKLSLLRLGWQLRKLGRRDMRELLRMGGMNVYDLLEEHFENAELKGALGLDATLGTNYGPRTPGTVLTLLYRLACEGAGRNEMVMAQGGMGAVCEAIAASARAAGAVIRLNSPVTQIIVESDRAAGVTLADGEQVRARAVVSGADPKSTLLGLLGARHLDTGFVRSVRHLRSRGLAAKLHLALNALPAFYGVTAQQLRGRLLISPSLDYIERAYNHSKYGEYSTEPVLEITMPSIDDAALAPAGRHVLSAVVQYAPYDLKGGWDAARQRFIDIAVQRIERFAPGLNAGILACELVTPADIERDFRISGGHWHHAEFAFDQFFMVRPVPGAAQYATPLPGLFLCGAGSHPGGGVTGLPGRNAARRIIDGTN